MVKIAPSLSVDPQKAYLDLNSEDTMVYDHMKLEILTCLGEITALKCTCIVGATEQISYVSEIAGE